MSKPIGDLVDSLGVLSEFKDEELVSGCVILLHIIDEGGQDYVRSIRSEGMAWVTQRGLMEIALDAERVPGKDDEDDQ